MEVVILEIKEIVHGELFKKNKLNEMGNSFGLNNIASFHAFITDLCGFKSDNGKVTGIASYGKINNTLKKNLYKVIRIKNENIVFNRIRYGKSKPNLLKLMLMSMTDLKY